MIPGKNRVLLQAILFYVHFLFESRVEDDGIDTAVYITTGGGWMYSYERMRDWK